MRAFFDAENKLAMHPEEVPPDGLVCFVAKLTAESHPDQYQGICLRQFLRSRTGSDL